MGRRTGSVEARAPSPPNNRHLALECATYSRRISELLFVAPREEDLLKSLTAPQRKIRKQCLGSAPAGASGSGSETVTVLFLTVAWDLSFPKSSVFHLTIEVNKIEER